MSGQSPSDGTGLLWAEIKRKILLALVENTELVALLGVDHSENLSDGLAYVVAVRLSNVSIRVFVIVFSCWLS